MLTVEDVMERYGSRISDLGYGRKELAKWLGENAPGEYTEHFARRVIWNLENLPRAIEQRLAQKTAEPEADNPSVSVEEKLRESYGITDTSWVPVSIWGEPSSPRAKWVRKIAGSIEPEKLQAWLDKTQVEPPEKSQDIGYENTMGVLSIRDAHFGLFSEHAGPNYHAYDLNEAHDAYIRAGRYLIARAATEDVSHLVIPFGSDMMHVDGRDNETTKGTAQDVNAQWWQALEMSVKALNQVVSMALEQFHSVTLVLESGNHDNDLSRVLSIAMKQRWEERLDLLDEPGSIKRITLGNCHVFFHHGDGISPEAYAGIIAGDHPDTVKADQYVEVLSGHLHHRRRSVLGSSGDYLEAGGIVHRVTPALCPASNWAESKGYRSTPGAELTIYDEDGLVALFEWTPKRMPKRAK